MFWLIILSTILIIIAIFLSVQFFNIIFRGFAPFISTKPEVIKRIINEIDLPDNTKIYELGCGKAGFLCAAEKKFSRAKLIGVEYYFWPWLIAKIQTSLSKSKIKMKRKNLFRANLADADLIYCYLNIKMMKKLEEKFKKECKTGTKIISYAFAMPNLKPEKVIKLNKGNKIYFYTL